MPPLPAASLRVWRLEFPQQPGSRFAWLGPYTSHWLTETAEELVRHMDREHTETHPDPPDAERFARHRALADPLLCGCPSRQALEDWFGAYLPALRAEGGQVAVYDVPADAVVEQGDQQLVFTQSRATLVERSGTTPPTPLIRSSAGSRSAVYAAAGDRYAWRGVPGPPPELTGPARSGPTVDHSTPPAGPPDR
jgi:hypothetical protein